MFKCVLFRVIENTKLLDNLYITSDPFLCVCVMFSFKIYYIYYLNQQR